jgi:hypothetical protein
VRACSKGLVENRLISHVVNYTVRNVSCVQLCRALLD